MNLRKISLYVLCLTIGLVSCNKDDEPTIEPVPEKDRKEQQALDIAALNTYLETHYYDASKFVSNPNPGISDIIIKEVKASETPPVGYVKLKTAVGEPKKVDYADIEYEYYVLKLNQGGGSDSPSFADLVRVNYQGFDLKGFVFDYSVNPITDYLTSFIAGWSMVFPDFNVSASFTDNSDGTVSYSDKGLGVMFLPSGLAYFSGAPTGVAAYSPLIFKFELLQMSEADQDNDGVPSYMEDIDGDGLLFDNTDGDFNPNTGSPVFNYLDSDDDNDGIPTKTEIANTVKTTINRPTRAEVKAYVLQPTQKLVNKIVKELDGTFTGTIWTFQDSDGDKIPDYLDKDKK